MNQEERPFIALYWPQLEKVAESHWSDVDTLQSVLCELKYRSRKGAIELRHRVTDHLVELSEASFLWPSTAVRPSSAALNQDNFWYEDGLLSFLGYRVGQNGVSEMNRRVVLDYVYNERIPNVDSIECMEEWGKPRTMLRLKKLADSLATFARNFKRRRSGDFTKAIAEWDDDLAYLKGKYYDGVYDFTWPRILRG